MQHPKEGGFTVIELSIVIALFAILGAFTMLFGADQYARSGFQADRDTLISLLERARAESMNNICLSVSCTDGKPHGVARVGGSYVLFEGASYAGRNADADALFPASPAGSFEATGPIVFSELSGTSSGSTITISDVSDHISVITVGSEGEIRWSR
jgi:prepilin-type N-terminal cleavage/methylation domain-containing protein